MLRVRIRGDGGGVPYPLRHVNLYGVLTVMIYQYDVQLWVCCPGIPAGLLRVWLEGDKVLQLPA